MPQYLKYIYVVLIAVIVIILFVLLSKLKKLMKKCAGLSENINTLKSNIDKSNEKIEDIEKTKESWQFFINAWVILTVLKQTFKLFKQFRKDGIKKAFVIACAQNAIKIAKLV